MLLLVLVLLLLVLLIISVTRKTNYWKNRGLVHDHGTLWRYTFGNRCLAEYYKDIYDKFKEDQIGVEVSDMPALMIKNLDDIQAVLARDFQSFYKRGIAFNETDLLCDNILLIDEFARWKILRHKLTPAFTKLRLKTMFQKIDKCARDFVEFIESDASLNAKQKPHDIVYTYATASIEATVVGLDTNQKSSMDSPFVRMSMRALTPTFHTKLIFLINNLFPTLFKFLQLKLFGDHEEFFMNAMKNVFETRRKTEKRNDFIDLCLDLHKSGMMKDPITKYELEPTEELLAAQAFFFFLAGADTTTNAIHFTLLELAGNPKILAKVHDSIDEIFKDGKTELDYDDLEKLQYLDMVSNEAMRKYPPIGQLQRLCTRDTVLPSNNLKIEKDTIIVLPTYALHRDAKLFPNPDLFDPERFAPDRIKDIQNYSFMAFGGGNRVCIGIRFARLQIKACLARLLRRFTLVERDYKPDRFDRSFFGLRDDDARYDFIPRDLK